MFGPGRACAVAARSAWRWALKEGGSQVAQELMITGVTLLWRLLF